MKLLRESLNPVPGTRIIPFSAQTRQGREEIWEMIDGLLEEESV